MKPNGGRYEESHRLSRDMGVTDHATLEGARHGVLWAAAVLEERAQDYRRLARHFADGRFGSADWALNLAYEFGKLAAEMRATVLP